MVNAMSKNLFQFKRNLDAFQLLSINKAERFGEREEGLLHNFKGGTFMCMTKQTEKSAVKRDYKSRMFTMIFRDKKELLQLYNAVAKRNYDDPELLTINTKPMEDGKLLEINWEIVWERLDSNEGCPDSHEVFSGFLFLSRRGKLRGKVLACNQGRIG